MFESVARADLLSDHFDSKQSRGAVDLRLTCHPSPSVNTFAFRSREVRRLLLELDPFCGTDPLGMFHLFHYTFFPVPMMTGQGTYDNRLMSLFICPPLMPITDRFP